MNASNVSEIELSHECEIFQLILRVIIVGITCFLGFLGNAFSIIVLRKEPCHPVTAFLLTALAGADFCFLIPFVVLMVPGGICGYRHVTCPAIVEQLLPHFERYGWAFASMCHMNTVYFTLFVTVHRYIFVCQPHSASRRFNIRRARVLVIVQIIFAAIYSAPRLFEFEVGKSSNDSLVPKRGLSEVGRNVYYQIIYKNVFFYLIMYIFPLSTIIALTWKLIQALRRQRKRMSRSTSGRRKDDNITFVLIIIIAIFIVCQTPTPIQRLLYAFHGEGAAKCGHFFFYFEPISDYLAVLNSCVNFIIYILFARRFRQTLCHMISSGKCCSQGVTMTTNGSHLHHYDHTLTMESMSHNGLDD